MLNILGSESKRVYLRIYEGDKTVHFHIAMFTWPF